MKKIVIAALAVILVLMIAAGMYVNSILNQVGGVDIVDKDTGEAIDTPEDKGISSDAPNTQETGIVNLLLLGVDNRTENEPARSDSMMIASIDKKNKTVKITSLMRDMYVTIPGKKSNRINTAYFMGGPALAIKTVNTNFNMNIEDYIAVDFFALEKIIDIVDGVDIDIKKAEVKVVNQYIDNLNDLNDGPKVPRLTQSGLQTLSGRQAVAYCRVRYVGRDDFERTERQRRVLNELFKKAKSISVTKIPELLNAMLPNVETSLEKSEILELAGVMLGFKISDLEQFRIPADGYYTDENVEGMAVLKPDIEGNKKLLHEFIYGTDASDETDTNDNTN